MKELVGILLIDKQVLQSDAKMVSERSCVQDFTQREKDSV